MKNEVKKNLLPRDGYAIHYEKIFSDAECALFFERLATEFVWKQEPIVIFGKPVMQPRLTALAGDAGIEYRYSGITMQAQPWTESLLRIKNVIEPLANSKFNTALLNFYRDQRDSMGWHRDNEKSLGSEPIIGSVSLGAAREFRFRHYREKSQCLSLSLNNGSFLFMGGSTQENWQHCVPKSSAPSGPRINITFRTLQKLKR